MQKKRPSRKTPPAGDTAARGPSRPARPEAGTGSLPGGLARHAQRPDRPAASNNGTESRSRLRQRPDRAADTVTGAEADRLAPGDIVAVTIKRLGINGEGVGYYKKKAIFIDGALPGETVRARITRNEPKLLYGTLIHTEKASAHRVRPFCAVYASCGGCSLQHLDYAAQLREKEELVREAFARYAGIAGDRLPLQPILGMEDPHAYRNKAQLQLGRSRSGDVIAGLYEPGSRRLVDISDCPMQQDAVNAVMQTVRRILQELDLPIADTRRFSAVHAAAGVEPDDGEYAVRAPGTTAGVASGRPAGIASGRPADGGPGRGAIRDSGPSRFPRGRASESRPAGPSALRTVVARASRSTGDVQLTFVTTGNELPGERALVAEIRRALPNVVSIAHNVNPADTPLIFGDRTRIVWGAERMKERLGELVFELSPRAFFQLNPSQTVRLYDRVKAAAALTGEEFVVDAYCGVGTISLWLAQSAKEVRGIEAVPEAVEDARRNARANGIANAAFHAGLAEELLPRWAANGFRPDVIVVDPPRSGCDRRLLDALLRARPERIVYVSCNPSTLAKDAAVLLEGGRYELRSVEPVDMFPHTAHVESVILMVCKN